MKKVNQLHCGACMTDFDCIDDLNEHLKNCSAALYMLPLIYQLWGDNDKMGHPLSHFIQCCHNEAHLIKRYACSIADDMDSFHRSKIHADLCEKLDLKYNEFRPFENSNITEIPNREEAKRILWQALFDYASQTLIQR